MTDHKTPEQGLDEGAIHAAVEAYEGAPDTDGSDVAMSAAIRAYLAALPVQPAPDGEGIEAEVNRILAISDEEVLAECRAAGEDPETVADGVRAAIGRAIYDSLPKCFICDKPLLKGQTALDDINEGPGHLDCFGTDRDGFVKDLDTGEPLGPDDPLPTGYPWPGDAPAPPSLPTRGQWTAS